jgi:hypothetical protein
MKRWAWALLACFFLNAALPLCSQGAIDLVALKKKEEERRKKTSKSKQAINDTNVNKVAGGGKSYGFVQMESETPPPADEPAPETAVAPDGIAGGAPPEAAEMAADTMENVAEEEGAPASENPELNNDADDSRSPAFWKKQQADLQGRIGELKESIVSEQSQLNKLWSDFYIKSIPAEQDAIKAQIGNLTNQIEQKKIFLSQAETELAELFEKARKAGVPPGWLR